MQMMCRPVAAVAAWGLLMVAGPVWAAEPPALARARALYNASDYDGAIESATMSRAIPQWADASALVIARAFLERHRRTGLEGDLVAARELLSGIRPQALGPRDRFDFIVGLGQSLFLTGLYGAAAELFDAALGAAPIVGAGDRLLLLEWWATALDREAQAAPPDRRPPLYGRVVERMEAELRDAPGNAVANYWLAVGARGAGDLARAWNAAIAAWVRAPLAPDHAAALRADIDRLVTEALVVERARTAGGQPGAQAAFEAEWQLVKQRWR